MSQFNIDEIEKHTLSGLKDFQRATVERVDYLFRHNQNRVLVADEVGMGKTLIARGAIVKTARLIKVLSLYRLTLGQARQEELLEYLFKEFKDTNGLKKLFIDLSPFSKGKEG